MKRIVVVFLATVILLLSACQSQNDTTSLDAAPQPAVSSSQSNLLTTSSQDASSDKETHTESETHISSDVKSSQIQEPIKKDTSSSTIYQSGGVSESPLSSQSEIPPKECFHQWKAASCESPEKCLKCGKTRGNALGHSYGEWKVVLEATASAEGKKERTCTRCGETETSVTPKLQVQKATAADARKISDKVIEYVNQYRVKEGKSAMTKLPGLTNYAEYRSRQIVTNFSHDTSDVRAAATALKYGEYVIPSDWGMTGEPYYTPHCRDAIGQSYNSGSIENVANDLASGVHKSSGHWAYVGSAEYPYVAVGITYSNGVWYCDIAVTSNPTYG